MCPKCDYKSGKMVELISYSSNYSNYDPLSLVLKLYCSDCNLLSLVIKLIYFFELFLISVSEIMYEVSSLHTFIEPSYWLITRLISLRIPSILNSFICLH